MSEPTEGSRVLPVGFARRAGAASWNDPTGGFRNRIRPLSSIHSRRLATRRCSLLSRRRSIHPCCLGGGARGQISRRHMRTPPTTPLRVKVTKVGKNIIVRPVADLGEVLAYTVPADGYLLGTTTVKSGITARVRLSRDRQAIDQEISVAGCDPAIFLAGEHLRRQKDRTSVVGWSMGSMAALRALAAG